MNNYWKEILRLQQVFKSIVYDLSTKAFDKTASSSNEDKKIKYFDGIESYA